MPKIKYILNPKTLEYELEKKNWKDNLFHILKYLFFVMITCFGLGYLLTTFYSTPKENKLNSELDNIEFEYKILNQKITNFSHSLNQLEERENNVYRLIYNTNPLNVEEKIEDIDFQTVADTKKMDTANVVQSESFNIESRMEDLKLRLYDLSKSYDQILYLAKNKEKMMRSRPAIFPIALRDLDRISSPFGSRIHPHYKKRKMHTGIDMTGAIGVPIYATADGVVSRVQFLTHGYGKNVMVNHGYGFQTLYGHCSEILVKVGQKVKRGQIIAKLGNTGISTGPHVHYEVRKSNKPRNPQFYFFKEVNDDDYKNHDVIETNTNPTISL